MIHTGYLPRCSANLRGAHILGNTIGNLVAGAVAGGGRGRPGSAATPPQSDRVGNSDPVVGASVAGSSSDDGADIVVTAKRVAGNDTVGSNIARLVAQSISIPAGAVDAGSAVVAAAFDRGSNPYPGTPEDMSGLTSFELRGRKFNYLEYVKGSGDFFTDNEANLREFDRLIQLADAREAPAWAKADAQIAEDAGVVGKELLWNLAGEGAGKLLKPVAAKFAPVIAGMFSRARVAESAGVRGLGARLC